MPCLADLTTQIQAYYATRSTYDTICDLMLTRLGAWTLKALIQGTFSLTSTMDDALGVLRIRALLFGVYITWRSGYSLANST